MFDQMMKEAMLEHMEEEKRNRPPRQQQKDLIEIRYDYLSAHNPFEAGDWVTQNEHRSRYRVPVPGDPARVIQVFDTRVEKAMSDTMLYEYYDMLIMVFKNDDVHIFPVHSAHFTTYEE